MGQVLPSSGHFRVWRPMCVSGDEQSDGPSEQPSFAELFELHHALEQIISAALREGSAICPVLVAEDLLSRFPRSGVRVADLHDTIVQAASRAGVGLRTSA